MRQGLRCLFLAVALIVAAGCSTGDSSAPGSPANLAARLEAAKGVSHQAKRDEALAQVALDAAAAGEGGTAREAIEAISHTSKKDDTALQAARRLTKAGNAEGATAVAKQIGNVAKRDEALAKIAKGESDE
jgi:hypothetical protein